MCWFNMEKTTPMIPDYLHLFCFVSTVGPRAAEIACGAFNLRILLVSKCLPNVWTSLLATILTRVTLWRPPAGTQKHKHMFIFSERLRHFVKGVKSSALVVNFLFYVFVMPAAVAPLLTAHQCSTGCAKIANETWNPTLKRGYFTHANTWHLLLNEFTHELWPRKP